MVGGEWKQIGVQGTRGLKFVKSLLLHNILIVDSFIAKYHCQLEHCI